MGWFWRIGDLPEVPHAAHLTQVLAQHEFQEAFKNYRDLRFLAKNLDDWKSKLGVFDDMLGNRGARPSPTSCRRCRRAPGDTGIELLAQAPRRRSPTRSPRASRPATASPSPTPRSSTCSSA